jgi:MFS family permease
MNPKYHKVFYGWWIVCAIFIISAYISGVTNFGFTAIIEPIANDLGWSYTNISFAASIRGLEMVILAPFLGVLADRWGPRKLIFTGIAITGLGLLLLSRINSLITFYGVFILIATGMSTCVGVVPMTVAANWFHRKVSTVNGIMVSSVAFGGLLLPLTTQIIDIFKWQTAMAIFGLGAWGLLLPVSFIIRHKPEQYGYLPDGDMSRRPVVEEGQTLAQGTRVDIRIKQVLKSSVFWRLALGLMCHCLVINAVITHVMPYLSTIGMTRSTSSLVASIIPVISICGSLSFGWFGDRFNKKRVTAIGFILTSVGLLFFGYMSTVGTWFLVPFLIFFGIGYGGTIPMVAALVREYFGRERFGTVVGFAMGVILVGGIIGAPLTGWIFDRFGNYQVAWFALASLLIVGMVSLVTTPSAGNTVRIANSLGDLPPN